MLAGVNCPVVDAHLIQPSFDMNWDRCLAILEHYKEQIQTAPRAIQVLKALRAQSAAVRTGEALPDLSERQNIETGTISMDSRPLDSVNPEVLDDVWFNQHMINIDWLDFY